MENRDLQVVYAGWFDLDIIPGIESQAEVITDLLTPGKPSKTKGIRVVPGGPVTNTGVSATRLGVKTELMGVVGTDRLSDLLLAVLEDAAGKKFEGIQRDPALQCPYVVGICPPKIERMYMIDTAAADDFGYDHMDWKIVERSCILHLGYPPWLRKTYLNGGEELKKIFAKAKELGCTTSLDHSQIMPGTDAEKEDWLAIMERWSKVTDIMMPSVEEALEFLDEEKYKAKRAEAGPHRDLIDVLEPEDVFPLADKLLDFGASIAVVKCGYKGFYIRTKDKETLAKIGAGAPKDLDSWGNRQLWHPIFREPPGSFVGSMGAGDSAIAGWFSAYVREKGIEETLQHAVAAGALNVLVLDGMSWNKGFDHLTNWVANPEFPVDPKFKITNAGWTQNPDTGIWHGPNDKTNA